MKKSLKAKSQPAAPMGHPPVLDIKPELPKPAAHMPERHKNNSKGQKPSR